MIPDLNNTQSKVFFDWRAHLQELVTKYQRKHLKMQISISFAVVDITRLECSRHLLLRWRNYLIVFPYIEFLQ